MSGKPGGRAPGLSLRPQQPVHPPPAPAPADRRSRRWTSPPMKICGTVVRPERRIASSRSGRAERRVDFAERAPPCGSADPPRARSSRTRAGCRFRHRPFMVSLRLGRWSRRRVTATAGRARGRPPARPPPAAPAASSTAAQAPQVAPEVITSSTSSTRRPAIRPARPGRTAKTSLHRLGPRRRAEIAQRHGGAGAPQRVRHRRHAGQPRQRRASKAAWL